MTDPAFSVLREGEDQQALDVLVTAFIADPVIRWMYPDATGYLTRFPAFLRAFGGKAFTSQTVWRLGDFEAVALWFPPHVEPDGDAVIAEVTQSVASDQHADFFAVLDQMDAGHPTFPHWYLPWFGVEGARQGKGVGSELMRNCLKFVDQDHLPATSSRPTRATSRSTNVTASRSLESRRLGPVRRSTRCYGPLDSLSGTPARGAERSGLPNRTSILERDDQARVLAYELLGERPQTVTIMERRILAEDMRHAQSR